MTVADTTATPTAPWLHRTLWGFQIILGLFLIIASALPKLVGEAYAVQTFEDMGAATWFRWFVGVVELAGGIGLLVPRLAGLAAAGLMLLMVGAGVTQIFFLGGGATVATPIILFVLFGFILWGRRASVARLTGR